MTSCLFASDLHGHEQRYARLSEAIIAERPGAVFLGGDLLPPLSSAVKNPSDHDGGFINDFLLPMFLRIRSDLNRSYPKVFLILGNDDPRTLEQDVIRGDEQGLWHYIHNSRDVLNLYDVYGYAYVPPTPFLMKDWERYDVSAYVDPGCVPPEEGWCSVAIPERERKYATIQNDLRSLVLSRDLHHSVFLFHAPPYGTNLDRAALDGKTFEGVPLDVHAGSLAIRRFIEAHQPLLTLHGHIHESARLTGSWRERLGQTYAFSGAHDGPELALVRFDLEEPGKAERSLL